ncbi:MAG: hypothetical protein OXU26_10255 [Acidobacteriota bacterium]|nr:hypothetical protein [Acidobacteriota bacterium]MDE2964286.1 hypothetical protein [Acidobacteriota bacterium]
MVPSKLYINGQVAPNASRSVVLGSNATEVVAMLLAAFPTGRGNLEKSTGEVRASGLPRLRRGGRLIRG